MRKHAFSLVFIDTLSSIELNSMKVVLNLEKLSVLLHWLFVITLIEENKHGPMALFDTVTNLTRCNASPDISLHSITGFMNYFSCTFDDIRDTINTVKLSATASSHLTSL